MARKKALIIGSSLLIAGSSLASQNDLFKTNDLGTAKEVKESILEINEVEGHDLVLSPSELCCAYGDGSSFNFKKQTRKYKRQARRADRANNRAEKRKDK